MPISFQRDGSARRILATLTPGERWEHYERMLEAELNRHPEWADWDWIIDDHGPLDDISVAGMSHAAELYRRHSTGAPTRTVVVTTDAYFEPWARVMDHHFGHRTHHAAPTLAAARALLDRTDPGVRQQS
jgi:enamine deaminase RidA (YjgF/YER057c/UK114 family)